MGFNCYGDLDLGTLPWNKLVNINRYKEVRVAMFILITTVGKCIKTDRANDILVTAVN